MKNILITIVLGFGLSSAPVTLPDVAGGGFSRTALAEDWDFCKGQKITNNWKFAVVDSKGKRKVFGPYKCQNLCRYKSVGEQKKDLWTMVSICEST